MKRLYIQAGLAIHHTSREPKKKLNILRPMMPILDAGNCLYPKGFHRPNRPNIFSPTTAQVTHHVTHTLPDHYLKIHLQGDCLLPDANPCSNPEPQHSLPPSTRPDMLKRVLFCQKLAVGGNFCGYTN
jgi:hypothetical protein